MKQVVVSVFDRASQLFSRPFFVQASGQAIRSFTDEVNRKDAERGDFSRHPDDFDLWQLATYDDGTGAFDACQAMLVRGKDVVIREDA